MVNKIVIENIPEDYNVASLQRLLSHYGSVDWIFIELDAETKKPWGYAYASMASEEQASAVAVASVSETLAIGSDDNPLRIRSVELGPDNYVDKSSLLNADPDYIYSRGRLVIQNAPFNAVVTLDGIVKGRISLIGDAEIKSLLPGKYDLEVQHDNQTIFQSRISITLDQSTQINISLVQQTGPLVANDTLSLKKPARTSIWLLLLILLLPLTGVGIWRLQRNVKPVVMENSKPTAPPGMISVPAGRFVMGRSGGKDPFEAPSHATEVKTSFYLDRTEVTNDQYQEFVRATGHTPPAHWHGNQSPQEILKLPVVNVSWQDAADYCKWRSQGSLNCRLPHEEEWELAARGTEGLLYPWGNDWRDGIANANKQHNTLLAVGIMSNNLSPYGALDMVGNVWEWTADDLKLYPLSKAEPQPGVKVIRGGAYDTAPDEATGSFRGFVRPDSRNYDRTGFRCLCN